LVIRLKHVAVFLVTGNVHLAGFGHIGQMTGNERNIKPVKVQHTPAIGNEVLRPVTSHSLAGVDEQVAIVGSDGDDHPVWLSACSAKGGQFNFARLAGDIQHRRINATSHQVAPSSVSSRYQDTGYNQR